MSLLALEGVRKSFGDNVVLRDIDLTVERGQCAVLIGASGSGTSTLLRCVNLLEVVDDGRVTLGGDDICDEVTSAFDPELVGEVLDLLRSLTEGGMTMVVNTHEMGFARQVADTVCFVDGGVISEQGPPAQVLEDPRQVRTRQFLSRVHA